MKKIYFILFSFFLLFGIVGCGQKKQEPSPTNEPDIKTDAQKFKLDYENYNDYQNGIVVNIDMENPMKYVEKENLLEFFKTGTGILYIGYPTCPWCRNMITHLINAANQENLKDVYYLNPSSIKDDNQLYEELKSLLQDYLSSNTAGEKILYVPDVYVIKEGKILGHHLGTVDSQEDPYVPLTEEEQKKLENIYIDLIKKIK